LQRQRALILGDFSEYKLASNDNGYDFDAMVAHLRETLDIPVVTGLPFGHTRDKLTLPFGGQATLIAERGGWHLAYRV
jgi:muramoyltetrapeptide carboxypeptidase